MNIYAQRKTQNQHITYTHGFDASPVINLNLKKIQLHPHQPQSAPHKAQSHSKQEQEQQKTTQIPTVKNPIYFT